MKKVIPFLFSFLLVGGFVYAAAEEFLATGSVVLGTSDTAVTKTVQLQDSTGTETITLACMGPGNFIVLLYANAGAGATWSGYVRLDSVVTTQGVVKQYSISRDSIMNVRLPDSPWNPGVSALKSWPNYFSYRVVLRSKGAGNGGRISMLRG